MIRKIQTYIEANHLLTLDKPVIVGFSGGGDSVSLLFILNKLGYKCIAAHCNFHLRGSESDRDENFSGKFAQEHNIIFEKVDFDTRSYATTRHISIEMAARDLRYEWFETIRIKYDAQAIAVAHHRDDSNETLLLNLIRGTGIKGLSGIKPRNGFIIRPLLCSGKEDITRFLESNNLPFITDSSNLSDDYTRNFIRLRLIPLMEELNPSVRSALSRTAEHLSDTEIIYNQTIESTKKTLIQKNVVTELQETNNDKLQKNDNNEVKISIKDILKQPAPKTILYELLSPYGFTREIAGDIFRSLTAESGKIFETPDTIYRLLKDRDFLILYKKSKKTTDVYEINEIGTDRSKLPIGLSISKVKIDDSFNISKDTSTATFDYDKLKFPLLLRKWTPGDWFIPFGMKGSKKLSDYFSDNKFNIREKEKTWLLCSGEDVIWIIGKRTDNRYRIDNDSKEALVIVFFEKK